MRLLLGSCSPADHHAGAAATGATSAGQHAEQHTDATRLKKGEPSAPLEPWLCPGSERKASDIMKRELGAAHLSDGKELFVVPRSVQVDGYRADGVIMHTTLSCIAPGFTVTRNPLADRTAVLNARCGRLIHIFAHGTKDNGDGGTQEEKLTVHLSGTCIHRAMAVPLVMNGAGPSAPRPAPETFAGKQGLLGLLAAQVLYETARANRVASFNALSPMNMFGNAAARIDPMQLISGNQVLSSGSNSRRLKEASSKEKERKVGKHQDPILVIAEAVRADVEAAKYRANSTSYPRVTPVPGSVQACTAMTCHGVHVLLCNDFRVVQLAKLVSQGRSQWAGLEVDDSMKITKMVQGDESSHLHTWRIIAPALGGGIAGLVVSETIATSLNADTICQDFSFVLNCLRRIHPAAVVPTVILDGSISEAMGVCRALNGRDLFETAVNGVTSYEAEVSVRALAFEHSASTWLRVEVNPVIQHAVTIIRSSSKILSWEVQLADLSVQPNATSLSLGIGARGAVGRLIEQLNSMENQSKDVVSCVTALDHLLMCDGISLSPLTRCLTYLLPCWAHKCRAVKARVRFGRNVHVFSKKTRDWALTIANRLILPLYDPAGPFSLGLHLFRACRIFIAVVLQLLGEPLIPVNSETWPATWLGVVFIRKLVGESADSPVAQFLEIRPFSNHPALLSVRLGSQIYFQSGTDGETATVLAGVPREPEDEINDDGGLLSSLAFKEDDEEDVLFRGTNNAIPPSVFVENGETFKNPLFLETEAHTVPLRSLWAYHGRLALVLGGLHRCVAINAGTSTANAEASFRIAKHNECEGELALEDYMRLKLSRKSDVNIPTGMLDAEQSRWTQHSIDITKVRATHAVREETWGDSSGLVTSTVQSKCKDCGGQPAKGCPNGKCARHCKGQSQCAFHKKEETRKKAQTKTKPSGNENVSSIGSGAQKRPHESPHKLGTSAPSVAVSDTGKPSPIRRRLDSDPE